MLLHTRDVGRRRVQVGPEQVELQGLFFDLVVLRTSVRAGFSVGGKRLRLEQVLNFWHRLPWLGALLSRGGVGELRLGPSQECLV